LDNKDLDSLLITAPFNTHSQIAKDALNAGKQVYGEKTMTKSYQGIRDLLVKSKACTKIFLKQDNSTIAHVYIHM